MYLRTLIINGSPRKNGDTVSMITEFKKHLHGEIIEITAYYNKISPCLDCRACRVKKGCVIHDDMDIIYSQNYDNVVIASPIYTSTLPGPLVSLANRFQAYYCAKHFMKDEFQSRKKRAALMIVGGGDGSTKGAIDLSKWIFKWMNASGFEENTVFSLQTELTAAGDDIDTIKKVREIASYFNDNTVN